MPQAQVWLFLANSASLPRDTHASQVADGFRSNMPDCPQASAKRYMNDCLSSANPQANEGSLIEDLGAACRPRWLCLMAPQTTCAHDP